MIFRQLFDSTSFTYTYIIGTRTGGEANAVAIRIARAAQSKEKIPT